LGLLPPLPPLLPLLLLLLLLCVKARPEDTGRQQPLQP
jgi:hypothetical protein